MFPVMFWGRLMRNWQLSHFSSAFNWMKVIYTMLTLSKNSYLWALIGNIKKSLTSPKWWKVYFSRKSLKEISWYAVYVAPVMLATHLVLLKSIHCYDSLLFTLGYSVWENSASCPERSCQLNKSQSLESLPFLEFLWRNRSRVWSFLLSRSLLVFQRKSVKVSIKVEVSQEKESLLNLMGKIGIALWIFWFSWLQ